jgi:lysozyme
MIMTYKLGVHVSHWDTQPQWGLLKAAGFEFAYVKATEPPPYMRGGYDPDYAYNTREARAAGLQVGNFHFYRNSIDPEKQARLFLGACYLPTDLPPALDAEDRRPVDGLEARLILWLSIVAEETGKTPIIYTSPSMIRDDIRPKTSTLASYPLWLAYWRKEAPIAPPPWTAWHIWQQGDYYTDVGRRSGVMIERMAVA